MRACYLWLAALLGAVLGSVPAVVLVLAQHAPVVPPTNARPAAPVAGAQDARWAELERRLSTLERQPRAALTETPEDEAAVRGADAELTARLAALELRVDALRAELEGLGPVPTTLAQIAKALEDRNLSGHQVSAAQRQRRMELRRKWLELAPEDPASARHLQELFGDLIQLGNADAALALLDRYAGPAGMSAFDTAMKRCNAWGQSGRHDQARQLYREARDVLATSEQERVSAGFWYAYSFQREGRYQEAIAEFEALIAPWAGIEPPVAVRSSVQGARNQIEKMRGWIEVKK